MTKYHAFFLCTLLVFALDQGTKVWARRVLRPVGYPNAYPTAKVVIKNFVELRYSENAGSAFGIFRNMNSARYILFGVSLVTSALLWRYVYRLPYRARWLAGKLSLLLAGGAGNLADRFLRSRVTDFIVLKFNTSSNVYEWPTFNLADAALVFGTVMLILDWPRDAIFRELP